MPVPLEQIYIEAARELEMVQINESLSAEDRLVFAQRYPQVWAMLEGRGLALWSEIEDVPDRYAAPVWSLLAEACAKAFQTEYAAPWALQELYQQTKPMYRYSTTQYLDF